MNGPGSGGGAGEPLGLSETEAASRRAAGPRFRPLPLPPPPGMLAPGSVLLDPPLWVLAGVAAALTIDGDLSRATAALGALLLWAALILVKLRIARGRLRAVAAGAARRVEVLRAGHPRRVAPADLAEGDAVVLLPGVRAPAPLEILHAEALETAGGPDGTDRRAAVAGEHLEPGRMAIAGRGIGRIRASRGGRRPQAPQRPDRPARARATGQAPLRSARILGWLAVPMLAVIGVWALRGLVGTGEALLMAGALAALVAPPGLGVATALAIGEAARRAARVGIAVRSAHALETLCLAGYVVVDRTDVTDVAAVRAVAVGLPEGRVLPLSGAHDTEFPPAGAEIAVTAAIACDDGPFSGGFAGYAADGSTEAACIALAEAAGLEPGTLATEPVALPAIEGERLAPRARAFREPDRITTCICGEPEAVLARCARMREAGGAVALAPRAILDQARRMAADGERVIAVARAETPERGPAPTAGFELLGLLGLAEPVIEDADRIIAAAKPARLRFTLVTEAPARVAAAQGSGLGLIEPFETIVTGGTVVAAEAERGEPGIDNVVRPSRVIAEAGPAVRRLVIDSLRRDDHKVAATARKLEDLAAAEVADVMLAPVDDAVDAVVERADATVEGRGPAPLVDAIGAGRSAFERLRRHLRVALGTGFGALILLLLASVTRQPLPVTPEALLALGLLAVGLADLALALDRDNPRAMERPPRGVREPLTLRATRVNWLVGGLAIGIGACLVAFAAGRAGVPEAELRGAVWILLVLAAAIRFAWPGNADGAGGVAPGLPVLAAAALTLAGGAALLLLPPAAGILGIAPPPPEVVGIAAAAAIPVAITEALLCYTPRKRRRRRFRRPLPG